MKVIFLDIDGVLNVIPQGHDEHGGIFHAHFIDNLKKIIDQTGAKIVISSSWRSAGLSGMQKMWADRKLPGEVIAITPYGNSTFQYLDRSSEKIKDSAPRGSEIKKWLDDVHYNKTNFDTIESYVILDDDCDFLIDQINNFVQCSENEDHVDCIEFSNGSGLTKICTDKAIDILMNREPKLEKRARDYIESECLVMKSASERNEISAYTTSNFSFNNTLYKCNIKAYWEETRWYDANVSASGICINLVGEF